MKKNLKNKIFEYLIGGLVSLSSALLSFYLIVGEYNTLNIIVTIVSSFLCAMYIYLKTKDKLKKNIKQNFKLAFIFCLLAIIIIRAFFNSKGIAYKNTVTFYGIDIFRFRYFCLTFLATMYYVNLLGFMIKESAQKFWESLDKWDKKVYKITSIVFGIVVVVMYTLNNNYFSIDDAVYSIDAGAVFLRFNNAAYYDIRHPLMNIFIFPVGAISQFLASNLVSANLMNLMQAILIQLINSHLLILIGLQLKKITNNKMVYIMYILSFTTLINVIFIEKYILCVFLLMLYVYTLCIENKSSIISLISATGVMPTSAFIGISEIIKKDDFKKKIKQIVKTILIGVLAFLALGRLHVFVKGIDEAKYEQQAFDRKELTIKERVNCTFNMFENSIIGLPSSVNEKNQFMWENITGSVSIISILIVILMLIGIIKKRGELFTKIATSWLVFAFILFIIINWSTYNAPLFTILFSWAVIPLLIYGIDVIIYKFHLNKKIIYGSILFIISLTNILVIFNIHNFLLNI